MNIHADKILILGAGQDNTLVGNGGDDILVGQAGNDTLDGGANLDTANYSVTRASAAVTRNLNGSITIDGGLLTDSAIGVKRG